MKYLAVAFFLTLPFASFACPSMTQVDATDRPGWKLDVPVDQNVSGILHQHSEQAEPALAQAQPKTEQPVTQPAEKKGGMHF